MGQIQYSPWNQTVSSHIDLAVPEKAKTTSHPLVFKYEWSSWSLTLGHLRISCATRIGDDG